MMNNKLDLLFESESFNRLYAKAERAIEDHGMSSCLKEGVLVGLSGGADSVLLLHLLIAFRRRHFDFKIVAAHVNHMIRGDEADRDEAFSKALAEALHVEFVSKKIDVPTLARERSLGIEECAREARYSYFADIISGRNDIAFIATAHNADDNLETVLLNILRGAGTRGGAGIPPVRDNIIRPMIYLSKKHITKALDEFGIGFVTDSTNLCSDYNRNFVRNEITPLLSEITEEPEQMFVRFSSNLRLDDNFISSEAQKFLDTHDALYARELLTLHKAVLIRVFTKLFGFTISESLFSDLYALLSKDNFSYSVKKDLLFVCERGICRVEGAKSDRVDFIIPLSNGVNSIEEQYSDIIISDTPILKSSLNVYSFSIQQNLSSAIINGSLHLRNRRDGDTVYYGGMTHKVKKLFCDRKIPRSVRERIPLLCDENGIVWIPGICVRDDGAEKNGNGIYAALCIKSPESSERFYSASEFKS